MNSQKNFKKDDYILSFSVQGVSVFVTDIHVDAYKSLEPLFIIEKGLFKQYFTKKAYERALDRGLAFYRDKHAFTNYRKGITSHCDLFKIFFETKIKKQKKLSRSKVAKFFQYTRKLCGDYTKMNFEYTDKAFVYKNKHPVIGKQLAQVGELKDSVRTVMNTILFEDRGYLTHFFKILGKQFRVAPKVLSDLTQREIIDLFNNKWPNDSRVMKRQQAFVESNHLKERFIEGNAAKRVINEFREIAFGNDIVKGQIASKGKAKGRVKIIPVDYNNMDRINSEIKKMKKGEILVAETTAPELMLACRKASAIVTNMGGLMSHAAIVSRELGIPCIVGTKIATKVFKDGDLVEVDATKGIVRKKNNA